MAITGTHVLLYSSKPEALRAMLRDVLGWWHVDAGEGWLIFALPPSELGVHPSEGPTYDAGTRHQFSLMCDDIEATIRELKAKGLTVEGSPKDEGWGIQVNLALPGGCNVMLYQPRHPIAARLARAGTRRAARPAKKKVRRPSKLRPAARAKRRGR
jgi:hypothetical protein